jgi:hypothetical protein
MFPSSTSGSRLSLLGTKAANFHILQQVQGSQDCNSYLCDKNLESSVAEQDPDNPKLY